MKSVTFRVFLAGMLLAGTVGIAGASTQQYISSHDLQTFDAQSKEIVAGMAKGGRFQSLSANDQARVSELLGLVRDVLVKYPDVNSIGERDKVLVFNSQEEINAILTSRDGKRLVCSRETPVGTHMSRKVCVTQAEKDQQYEQARRLMESRPGNTINSGN